MKQRTWGSLSAGATDLSHVPSPVGFLYVGQASFSGVYLKQATTLACSPSSATAVVGTMDGCLYFLDIHNVEAPRVIHKIFLSESPVKILM